MYAVGDPDYRSLRFLKPQLPVEGMVKRNGDPYMAGAVVDALEALTVAPEEPEEVEAHPLLPRDAGDGVYVTRS